MRLKEDSSSWKSRSIKRRDFRHDPGLPEDEVPRQTGLKRKKKKHVHDWKKISVGTETRYSYRSGQREPVEVEKTMYVCKRCGNKKDGRYYGMWWW